MKDWKKMKLLAVLAGVLLIGLAHPAHALSQEEGSEARASPSQTGEMPALVVENYREDPHKEEEDREEEPGGHQQNPAPQTEAGPDSAPPLGWITAWYQSSLDGKARLWWENAMERLARTGYGLGELLPWLTAAGSLAGLAVWAWRRRKGRDGHDRYEKKK